MVPEVVTWPRLSEALGCYFHAQTGRGLTPQNLDYLGRKLLGVGGLAHVQWWCGQTWVWLKVGAVKYGRGKKC